MPKAKPGMTPEEQSRSFSDAVKRMTDAGELNLTEADTAFEQLLGRMKVKKHDSQSS